MTQQDIVYNYLKQNYAESEPIFLSELSIPGVKDAYLRQCMKKLVENDRIKRYDTGIYYLPENSIFRSGSGLSADSVIQKKYLSDHSACCGYMSGLLLANQLGITTQVPMVYEVYTNKATTAYRETTLAGIRVILRRPCVEINDRNAAALQFLDLMKDISSISELEGGSLKERLLAYMNAVNLNFDSLRPYLQYYPERIYKNMYEAGLLDGISA